MDFGRKPNSVLIRRKGNGYIWGEGRGQSHPQKEDMAIGADKLT